MWQGERQTDVLARLDALTCALSAASTSIRPCAPSLTLMASSFQCRIPQQSAASFGVQGQNQFAVHAAMVCSPPCPSVVKLAGMQLRVVSLATGALSNKTVWPRPTPLPQAQFYSAPKKKGQSGRGAGPRYGLVSSLFHIPSGKGRRQTLLVSPDAEDVESKANLVAFRDKPFSVMKYSPSWGVRFVSVLLPTRAPRFTLYGRIQTRELTARFCGTRCVPGIGLCIRRTTGAGPQTAASAEKPCFVRGSHPVILL